LRNQILPIRIEYLTPTMIDLLLFWNNNKSAINYIIRLYLKYKYDKMLQQFSVPRFNIIWAIRRNFFIKNTYALYEADVPLQCIKIYMIIKQLLDDIQDYTLDKLKKETTPLTIKNYFVKKEYYFKYINNIKLTNPQRKLCNTIFRFHLLFLDK